jgi:lipopolysaccharide export system protein LptC
LADIIESRGQRRAAGVLARGGAFGAADRHSRRVRILKIAVPGLACLGALVFVVLSLFNPFARETVNVDVGKLNVSGDRLTMELPRLTGFNRRQEAYNVTAKTASQKLTAPGLIDLTDLEAIISMPGNGKATLKALTGKFDSSAELLQLHDNVTVVSTKGYAAKLAAATVDFKAGTVKSDDPVKVDLESGTVEAGALAVSGGGDIIVFNKGVSTRFETPTENRKRGSGAPTRPQPEQRGTTQ